MVDFKAFYKDKANVAYMVMAYPNFKLCEDFLNKLDESDIDILEIGIPYSDPISDGKIISEAALKALEGGADIEKIFTSLEKIKTKKSLSFFGLLQSNIFIRHKKICKKSKRAKYKRFDCARACL